MWNLQFPSKRQSSEKMNKHIRKTSLMAQKHISFQLYSINEMHSHRSIIHAFRSRSSSSVTMNRQWAREKKKKVRNERTKDLNACIRYMLTGRLLEGTEIFEKLGETVNCLSIDYLFTMLEHCLLCINVNLLFFYFIFGHFGMRMQ